MIKAIVYTSKNGSTEWYAKLLSEKTGIPSYTLKEASKTLSGESDIAYLGCVRADGVMDLKKAEKAFKVKMVCAVGMSETGENTGRIRKANQLSDDIALFTLQGNYLPDKLKGADKLIMKLMSGVLLKQMKERGELSDGDREMVSLLTDGGDRVSEANASAPLEWIRNNS